MNNVQNENVAGEWMNHMGLAMQHQKDKEASAEFWQTVLGALLFTAIIGILVYGQNFYLLQSKSDDSMMEGTINRTWLLLFLVIILFVLILVPQFIWK